MDFVDLLCSEAETEGGRVIRVKMLSPDILEFTVRFPKLSILFGGTLAFGFQGLFPFQKHCLCLRILMGTRWLVGDGAHGHQASELPNRENKR